MKSTHINDAKQSPVHDGYSTSAAPKAFPNNENHSVAKAEATGHNTAITANTVDAKHQSPPNATQQVGLKSSKSSKSLQPPPDWPKPPDQRAYHGLAGEIVSTIAPHTEADPVALLIQLFVAFGNIIGRSAYYMADGSRHHLNLFVTLVGVSSKGRKGTSWARVTQFLNEVDPDWVKNNIVSGLSSGEGLIWQVRDQTVKLEPMKDKGNPTGDYIPVITDEGVTDKRRLVLQAEFGATLRVTARETNTLSPTIREAWDSGQLRIMTKNDPAVATEAHISIVGHITVDELKRYLGATEAVNGFGNRFLWVCTRRYKLLPEGGGDINLGKLPERLKKAVEFARKTERINFDEPARELWHSIYEKFSDEHSGLLGTITGRAEAQTIRLAAIYALLDESAVIKKCHLQAALALWEYCEASAEYIFGGALSDPVADKIARALRNKQPEGLTQTEILHELFQKNEKAARINSALDELQKSGTVRCEQQKTQGRAAHKWFYIGEQKGSLLAAESAPKADEENELNDFETNGAGTSDTNIVNVVNVATDSNSALTHEVESATCPSEWEEGEL